MNVTPETTLKDFGMEEEGIGWIQIVGAVMLCVAVGVVCWVVKCLMQIRKQIAKASHIAGYWQILEGSLIPIPILAPYIAHGNMFGRFTKMIEKAHQESNGQPTMIRISTSRRNTMLIWDPDMCREVLVTKSNCFHKPTHLFYEPFNIFRRDVSNILSAEDGVEWKRHHRVCAPAFSTANLQCMCVAAVRSTDLLVESKWEEMLRRDKEGFRLDLNDFSDVTLDVIGKAGFGVDFGMFGEGSSEGRQFRMALNKMIKLTGNEAAFHIMNKKLDAIIKERKEMFTSDPDVQLNDLLSQLVKANMHDKVLDQDELKSNAYIFTIAGHETTSTTLKWIMYELSKHPDKQAKARQEAISIGGGADKLNPPTFDDYPNMDYISSVMMETLRLHPPVIVMVKDAVKTTTLGNQVIPKGSCIYINAHACHKLAPQFNTSKYKGTDFAPERFMDKEFRERVINQAAWLPFSRGSRKCIGFVFSQQETCMILCRLLQRYEFVLQNDETSSSDKVSYVEGITMQPTNLKILVRRCKQQ